MRTVLAVVASGLLGLGAGACGDDGGSAAAFCDLARTYEAEFGDAEPEAGEQGEALQRLRRAAPREIRDDMATIVELYERLATTPDDDFEARAEQFARLEGVQRAGANVERYLTEECGIDGGGDGDLGDDEVLDDGDIDDGEAGG